MQRTLIDLQGHIFGNLTVLGRLPNRGASVYWLCLCSCGIPAECSGSNLRNGKSRSCGCSRTRHGLWKSAEYSVWRSMRQRCNTQSHPAYSNYGGRGINVCVAWDSFAAFARDMGPRPTGYSLERVDNSLGYFPANCVWATHKEQGRNRRTNKLTASVAEAIYLSEGPQKAICQQYGISQSSVSRIKSGKQWTY